MPTLAEIRRKMWSLQKRLVIQTHLMCLIRLKIMSTWVQMGGLKIWLVKKANFSGSSLWNVGVSSTSTTPIVGKIDKIERLIIDGKVALVDDEGKPLKKVDSSGDHDSEDEIKSVDKEMASFWLQRRLAMVNSHELVGLCKWALTFVIAGSAWPLQRVSETLAGLVLLLRHGTSDSGPDMSFDTSASPEGLVSFAKRRNIEDVCMDEGTLSMKKWKNKFFLIDRRAIPDYLTWRHSHSCFFVDLPTDGYDRNDVAQLCAHLIRLRKINEAVLVRSGISSIWFNQKCNLAFRRKDDNYGRSGNAKVVEEPHKFTNSIFQHVHNHTSVAAAKGTPIPLPTLDKVAAGHPYPKLAKKSKAPVKRKEPTSLLGPSEPDQLRRKRRLRRKASNAGSSAPVVERAEDTEATDLSKSNYCTILEDTLDKDEVTFFRAAFTPPLRLGKRLGSPPTCLMLPSSIHRMLACLMLLVLLLLVMSMFEKYDRISKDDFANASLGEEIDLTLFPLAPGPYVMPYPFADDQENKDLHSLNDVSSEKVRKLKGQLVEAEAATARVSDELTRIDAKLSDQELVTRDLQNDLALERLKSQEYKDVAVAAEHHFHNLKSEVTRFVGSGVDCLVCKLLSSDEFITTLARILTFSITSMVERGLHMGRTDAEFEQASHNVSNFFLGVEAKFNKVVAALPFISFPFLVKIAEAAEGALLEVVNVQPDKIVRSAVPTSVPAMFFPTGKTFGWTSGLKESGLAREHIARRGETCAPSFLWGNSIVAFPFDLIIDCLYRVFRLEVVVNEYIKYGQKRSKMDKTEHGNGRVQEIKAGGIYILNGPTRSRLKIGEHLKALDPSTPHYKRRPRHTEMGM
ncbi:hypothetical protein Tco_0104588 [Tanacetum coccineum]